MAHYSLPSNPLHSNLGGREKCGYGCATSSYCLDLQQSGKSVFAAISFHAMSNVSELVLFPIYGSYYDPFIAFIVMTVATAIVIFLWGPETLVRYRYSRSVV